jgi:hypothetical protein
MTIDERMRYAGTIGLLCECSIALGHGPEKDDLRDSIEKAALDWAKTSGWTVRRVLHRIEVMPPKAND